MCRSWTSWTPKTPPAFSRTVCAFRFGEVAPGLYLLTATAPRWAAGERAGVALLPGEARTGVVLDLAAEGAELRGQVIDAAGGANQDRLEIRMGGAERVSDRQGRHQVAAGPSPGDENPATTHRPSSLLTICFSACRVPVALAAARC